MHTSSDTPGEVLRGEALVVEDNMLIAMQAEEILLDLGSTQCHSAGTVKASLEILDAAPIAFALLDINLGNETCEDVAARLHAAGTPFIFASGYNEFPGFYGKFDEVPVVIKPYTQADIARAISQLGVI